MLMAEPQRHPGTLGALPPLRTIALGSLAIVLATLIAYQPAIHAGFIWDDDSYVTENPHLRDAQGLRNIWVPGRTPQYYPMVFTTFWIEHQMWDLDPMGYHVVNVLLHGLSAAMLWLVVVRLRVPGGVTAAWLIAAIFALHPVHVESVAWITERKNVLSLFFYLPAAMAYLEFDRRRHALEGREAASGTSGKWMLYAASLVLFMLALLSKSVTCSLPAALVLVMLWLRQPITLKRLLPLAPMFIVGFALAMHTAYLERRLVGAVGDEFAFSFMERTIIASNGLLFYPWKLLWPHPLMFIYPRWAIDASDPAQYVPLMIVLAIGIVCLIAFVRGTRGPFVALAFFAGTVFPALGYFNVYPHIFSFVADHFQYHASIGFIAFVIGGTAYVLRRAGVVHHWPLVVVAAIVVPKFCVLTWRQALTYESAETVWRDTLSKNPTAWMPNNNMATSLLKQAEAARVRGDEAAMRELAIEAERYAAAAIESRRTTHTAHFNLSEALRLQGRFDEALASITHAIDILPTWAEYRWQRGRLLHLLGRLDEATEAYREAVEFEPHNSMFRRDLAQILAGRGRLDEAADHYIAAIERNNSDFASLSALAAIRIEQGVYGEAAALLFLAKDAAPNEMEYVRILTRMVWFFAECPDPDIRDVELAVRLAHHLVEFTGSREPGALGVLASALSAAGRRMEAIDTARRALAMARAHGLDEVARLIAEQLERLEAGPAGGA
jgi:protein O-mannosyl-transferase